MAADWCRWHTPDSIEIALRAGSGPAWRRIEPSHSMGGEAPRRFLPNSPPRTHPSGEGAFVLSKSLFWFSDQESVPSPPHHRSEAHSSTCLSVNRVPDASTRSDKEPSRP